MKTHWLARTILVVFAFLALVPIACADDDEGDEPTPQPTVSAQASAVSESTAPVPDETPGADASASPESSPAPTGLAALLISTQDMPADWIITEQGAAAADVEFCDVDFPSDVEPEEFDSITFARTSDGRFVSQYLARYEDGEAEDVIDELRDETESCDEWTQDGPDGTTVTWRVSTLSLPGVGDESIALTTEADIATVGGIQTHMLISRRGDLLNWVSYGGSPARQPIEPSDLQRYALITDGRLPQ